MSEYQTISGEFWGAFNKGLEMVLATSAGEDVTARTVNVVHVEEKIYFATFDKSVKYGQIQQNRNVALCIGHIHLKGTARIAGDMKAPENETALAALAAAFPDDIAMFGQMPGMVIVEIQPISGGFGRIKTGGMFVIDFIMQQAHKLQFG